MLQSVGFQTGKEKDFEQDFLYFASDRYGSETTRGWTVAVMHVNDSGDWMDLYEIARYSHLNSGDWIASDAYSITWDTPVADADEASEHSRRPTTALTANAA